jgi:hypothetical protein
MIAPSEPGFSKGHLGISDFSNCYGLVTTLRGVTSCLKILEPQPLGTLRACQGL